MSTSKIEWTDKTWNPITGCSKVSPACDHCYARRMARRLAGRYGYPADVKEWSPERGGCYVTRDASFDVTFHEDRLDEPLHWRKPSRVFVCSMGDLFHEDVQFEWIMQAFAAMSMAPRHLFFLLTKRPEKMRQVIGHNGIRNTPEFGYPWPLPNVYLGVTVEAQRYLWRVDTLGKIPAAKTFVSHEPLLGSINYGRDRPGLDWVIVGAETGPGARPMQPEWAHDLYRQCKAAGVPFFFKKGTPGFEYDPAMVATREWPE